MGECGAGVGAAHSTDEVGDNPVQKYLTGRRDRLRRELRYQGSPEDLATLNKLNQALSMIHAGAYPGAAVDWDAFPGIGELLESLS